MKQLAFIITTLKRVMQESRFATLFVCLVVTCAMFASGVDYIIEGDIKGIDGKKIFLYDYDKKVYIDTTVVSAGHFKFDGNYERNAYVRVEQENLYANCVLDSLVLIDMEAHRPINPVHFNLVLQEYDDAEERIIEDLQKFYKEIKSHGFSDFETGNIYKQLYDKYAPERQNRYAKAVIDNPNGVGEALLLTLDRFLIKPEVWDTIYSQMKSPLKETRLAEEQNKLMVAKKRAMPGQPFIDFEGKTIEGKTVKLSDYVGKGKYVLVDFYASWCGPCRQEAKDILIPLYQKYGTLDNFEILGAIVWDEPEATKKFIESVGYPWPQMIDCGMLPMELYGFDGVPMIFLFGPDGTILERELRGTYLVKAVESRLNNE